MLHNRQLWRSDGWSSSCTWSTVYCMVMMCSVPRSGRRLDLVMLMSRGRSRLRQHGRARRGRKQCRPNWSGWWWCHIFCSSCRRLLKLCRFNWSVGRVQELGSVKAARRAHVRSGPRACLRESRLDWAEASLILTAWPVVFVQPGVRRASPQPPQPASRTKSAFRAFAPVA